MIPFQRRAAGQLRQISSFRQYVTAGFEGRNLGENTEKVGKKAGKRGEKRGKYTARRSRRRAARHSLCTQTFRRTVVTLILLRFRRSAGFPRGFSGCSVPGKLNIPSPIYLVC